MPGLTFAKKPPSGQSSEALPAAPVCSPLAIEKDPYRLTQERCCLRRRLWGHQALAHLPDPIDRARVTPVRVDDGTQLYAFRHREGHIVVGSYSNESKAFQQIGGAALGKDLHAAALALRAKAPLAPAARPECRLAVAGRRNGGARVFLQAISLSAKGATHGDIIDVTTWIETSTQPISMLELSSDGAWAVAGIAPAGGNPGALVLTRLDKPAAQTRPVILTHPDFEPLAATWISPRPEKQIVCVAGRNTAGLADVYELHISYLPQAQNSSSWQVKTHGISITNVPLEFPQRQVREFLGMDLHALPKERIIVPWKEDGEESSSFSARAKQTARART